MMDSNTILPALYILISSVLLSFLVKQVLKHYKNLFARHNTGISVNARGN